MFLQFNSETMRINDLINRQAKDRATDKHFLEYHIQKFLNSPVRRDMLTAYRYYNGDQDILKRERTVIGENGKLETVHNLPNNKLIDNQYAKLVDQKTNYILGKPIGFDGEENDLKIVNQVFNKKFKKLLKNISRDSINCGIGWLYVYYDEFGKFSFKRFKPYEILPFWSDDDHTELSFAVRIYVINEFVGGFEKDVYKVEVYSKNGIHYFDYDNGKLLEDVSRAYMQTKEQPFNWDIIPLIAFKSNEKEIPLIKKVKGLQDALNTISSDFMNNMQEDARNTILIIKNYGGTDEFDLRKNLAETGIIKIDDLDGAGGGVETLKIEVNSENYKIILGLIKKAMIENCKGYDINDLKSNGSPNEMTIKATFSDIDLDANEMETEFQASLEQLFGFVSIHLELSKTPVDFSGIRVIFDRDLMINESQIIQDLKSSFGIISLKTLLSMHPYVNDVAEEFGQLKLENSMSDSQNEDYSFGSRGIDEK